MALSNKFKKDNLFKKLLSNLPEGYLEDYIKLFLIQNTDGTYSAKPVSIGTDAINQMEKKYKKILKTQYPKSRTEGEFLKGIRIRDINSAIKHADLIIIHTEWNDFKSINFKKEVNRKNFIIFDMRNIYSPTKMKELKIKYFGVGH